MNPSKTTIKRALTDLFRTMNQLALDKIQCRSLRFYNANIINRFDYLLNNNKFKKIISKIDQNYDRITHYQDIIKSDVKFSEDLDKQSILKS